MKRIRKKAFTLIEMLVVVIIISVLFSTILWISIANRTLPNARLQWYLLNADNVYFKWDWNKLNICDITLTWDIWSTKLVPTNCQEYEFYNSLPDWINFFKVQNMILDQNLNLVNNYDKPGVFEVKNWILLFK